VEIINHCLIYLQFSLAEECLKKAKDLSGLLLLYTASGNAKAIKELAETAGE